MLPGSGPRTHARFVRVAHGIVALSVITLVSSGVAILMVHPRLYWGEAGNDLMPALLELPISRNHQHGGWTPPVSFSGVDGAPVSASRTYEIFNQNGWARSLHFLAGWLLTVPGLIYLVLGLGSGHFRAHVWPRVADLAPARVWHDVLAHLRGRVPPPTGGPDYGVLQKVAYAVVVFVAAPVMVVTGLTMSPAVTASFPLLLALFGGYQSARTIHFAAFVALVLFVVVHLVMVVASGWRAQLRAITVGGGR